MRIPLLLNIAKSRGDHKIPMQHFYSMAGISRQGFFQALHRANEERAHWESLPELVQAYRGKKDARAGSLSLFYNLKIKSLFEVGINKFQQKMREMELTLPALKTRIITTRSVIHSLEYSNLVNGLILTGINQLVVGDITYIRQGGRWTYLICLTDVYSSRIVGWNYGETMFSRDAYNCVIQWVELRGAKAIHSCIHHSDGGGQYFSNLYLGRIKDLEVRMSRAENCLQNGHAEQINGLIKHHFIPIVKGSTVPKIRGELKRLIHVYNSERKQERLLWKSPVEYEQYLASGNSGQPLELHNFEPK